MNDLIKREDAIKSVLGITMYKGSVPLDTVIYLLKDIPSAEPKQVLTEEVREAIMRLTMCARHECAVCKLSNNEDDCYEIATNRMHILADAFEEPKQGEWIERTRYKGFPDYECSVCTAHGQTWMNYCPSCGARMVK